MKTEIAYTYTKSTLSVFIDGKSYSIYLDKLNSSARKELHQALDTNNKDMILSFVDRVKAIEKYAAGNLEIKDGNLLFNGTKMTDYLAQIILEMQALGSPISAFMNFYKNMLLCPSAECREHIYKFLEYGNLPITNDGCFLAYKYVKENYRDCYTGQFDNSVGNKLVMPRHKVDDNPNSACSYGFHVGTLQYSGNPGPAKRVVICKVNPRDVCAVPFDYEHQKMRVCEYIVVGEMDRPLDNTYTDAYNQYNEEDEYYDDEDDVDDVDDIDEDEVDEADYHDYDVLEYTTYSVYEVGSDE